jgi:hypothetical protein
MHAGRFVTRACHVFYVRSGVPVRLTLAAGFAAQLAHAMLNARKNPIYEFQ